MSTNAVPTGRAVWFNRFLLIVVCLLVVWAVIIARYPIAKTSIGPWTFSSQDPTRPLALGLMIGVYHCFFRKPRSDDASWLVAMLRHASAWFALAIALGVLALALTWGSFVAGGADSSGYLSQAQLWLKGSLRVPEMLARVMPWPYADATFSPLGYRPATVPDAIVPVYSPGLPLLMALGQLVAGRYGPFSIVPLLGALAVLCTYSIAARVTGDRLVGLTAALFLAASPPFLMQLMNPMSDVPAAAFWMAAIALALREARASRASSGLCAAVAVLIRPNLIFICGAFVVAFLWPGLRQPARRRAAVVDCAWFLAGVAPGVVGTMVVNQYLYGSPLRSGYGDLSVLFAWSYAPVNLAQYGRWFVETHTPLVLLGLVGCVAPWTADAPADDGRISPRVLLLGVSGVTIATYMCYQPFDAWWFLRFLLPALPLVICLAAFGGRWVLGHLPPVLRLTAALAIVTVVVGYECRVAVARGVFDVQAGEQHYFDVGCWVAEALPSNAVVVSMQESGSARYYSGRVALRYDLLPHDWLDRAIEALRQRGFHPYILLEDGEEAGFRRRFAAGSLVGRVDWEPLAELTERRGASVRIYDVDAAQRAAGMMPPPRVKIPRLPSRLASCADVWPRR